MTDTTTRSGLLRGAAAMAVAMGVMNMANYGYTVVAAHVIGPAAFGAFSALMGLLLVLSVLSLGLQATGARRISADPAHVAAIERVVLGVTYRGALALGALCLVLAPLLDRALNLDSLPTAFLVAAAVVPATIYGGQSGVLQGEERWAPLALVYLAQGVGRFGLGIGLILVWPSEFSAFLGVAIGMWVPVLVGAVALRRPRATPVPAVTGAGTALIKEVASSSQALLAFFALSNADILLARGTLDSEQAGLYAGGLILVKAILFLPQFVVVIAFPSMAREGGRGTIVKSVGVALALGLVALGGVLALPGLARVFIGGPDFAAISDSLWLFAVVGTLLSAIQVLVYSALARQHWPSIAMIWTTLLVLVVLAFSVHAATSLVVLVAVLDGLLFLGLLAVALVRQPTAAPARIPVEQQV